MVNGGKGNGLRAGIRAPPLKKKKKKNHPFDRLNFLCRRSADFPCTGNAGIDFHTSHKHSTPSSSDTRWQRRSLTCNFLSSPRHRASHYLLVSIIVISFLFITCLSTHFEGNRAAFLYCSLCRARLNRGLPLLRLKGKG